MYKCVDNIYLVFRNMLDVLFKWANPMWCLCVMFESMALENNFVSDNFNQFLDKQIRRNVTHK